ncbi:hypothetical protein D6T64_20540 [Cryobacterium melibiosiphilum]|uniref:Uncharacterized protein n=1 Tax=Cryobacterium melibiosiphilum TaxID=995039 RepID=A0A3A5MGN5_9MICO|nr:hypothetical protein [Cryobacterium melibiosiphilum]RJT84561.1 hypothetical protein D6T64_20540 [Cryobacterium melibiosiphilum]
MNTVTKIRTVRRVLLILVAGGICLLVYALFIGWGLASVIAGVAGSIALVVGLIGLIVFAIQKFTAASRGGSWRPADDDER